MCIKLEDNTPLPSSPTHRSKRHEKGQAEIKCVCEKSTHKTSPGPPLAYSMHLSSIMDIHFHTLTHTLNVSEWLKG